MFKYKNAYKIACETIEVQDRTIETVSSALTESQSSLQKYIDENNALMESLEKTKRSLDTAEKESAELSKEYTLLVEAADKANKKSADYIAGLEAAHDQATAGRRNTGDCQDCRYLKIPQKCASCTRNPRAVDKFDACEKMAPIE